QLKRAVDVGIRRISVARMPEAARKLHCDLRCPIDVSPRTKPLEPLLKQVDSGTVGAVPRAAGMDEQPDTIRVLFGPELKGRAVEASGGGGGGRGGGAVARRVQREAGALGQSGVFAPRGPGVLEGALVVVRKHLGVILWAAERLDPARRAAVLFAATSTRNLAVGDVA